MLMYLEGGECFSTGAQPYQSRPALDTDSTNRLFVEIEIEGLRTSAILDTGAPYAVCPPRMANFLGLSADSALLTGQRLNVRGLLIRGSIHRVILKLRAERGQGVTVEATVFVPEEEWPLPAVLGWDGCLQRLRFAIDPLTETFYFGYPH